MRGSFSDKKFKCVLDMSFPGKHLASAFCSSFLYSFNYPAFFRASR